MNRVRKFSLPGWALVLVVVAVFATVGGAGAATLVRSGDIANGTIRLKDLNKQVKNRLNDWFAKVDANGNLVAGRHVRSVSRTGPGDFNVVFNRRVTKCAPVASVRGTPGVEAYGFITTYTPGGRTVRVVIRSPAGNKADLAGFNLVSSC
jgi:hypothetical protein